MATQPEKEKVPEDPLRPTKWRVLRFKLLAALCCLGCAALFAASVAVVGYSAMASMGAFKDLPRYRVNLLLSDYKKIVAQLDNSYAATNAMVKGEVGNQVLWDARLLAQSLLRGEEQYVADVESYRAMIASVATGIGGAQEWNQHFQTRVDPWLKQSQDRQQALHALLARYPAATEPNVADPDQPAAKKL